MSWVLKQVIPVNQFQCYAINGTDLFVANEDFAIRHWNLISKEVVGILRGHKGKITDLEYSDDWKALFSTSIDGFLNIWYSGKLIAQYLNKERRSDCFGSPLFSCTFYARANQLIVGANSEILVFQISWELIQKTQDKDEIRIIRPISRYRLHTDVIHRAICAGDKLITASMDRTVGYSRLDSLSVNKVLPLNQKQAICNFIYDPSEEIVFIGTIDGRIHAVTRDGLVIQSDSIGYECGVISLAIDRSIGLIWAVLACGEIRLLDIHNFTTDLTDYFDTLRERPIQGVEKHRFFGVHYDEKTKLMYAFCNDHYVFEFKYDDSAARVTFYTQSPMHSLALVDFQGPKRVDRFALQDALSSSGREEHLKPGQYIIGGDRTMQIYLQQNRFQYDQVSTTHAKSHTTCVCFSNRFFAFGDDKGNVYCVRTSDMQIVQSLISLKGAISSIHLTQNFIIATTLSGSWSMFPLDIFPEPLEESNGREMAHNGAINDSVYDPTTGTLITIGYDGMLKCWQLSDEIPDKTARRRSSNLGYINSSNSNYNHNNNGLFITENEQTLAESSVVDMRKWGEVKLICWAKKANRWVTVHGDSQIRVWNTDIVDTKLLITIPCGGCHVTAVDVDDPEIILAAIDDKTIRCFSLQTGELLRTFTGHKDIICKVAANPATDYYVSSSWDGAVKVWSKVDLKLPRISSSIYSTKKTVTKTTDKNSVKHGSRPKTAIARPKNATVFQPISLYEKRKQEIERRRRREKAEFDAKMRSPVARELQSIAKHLLESM